MRIELERETGNVRFGSRKWAARQKEWMWGFGRSGDEAEHLYISCADGEGGRLIVLVLTLVGDGYVVSQMYGGALIGEALTGDLATYAQDHIDSDEDDEGELLIEAKV